MIDFDKEFDNFVCDTSAKSVVTTIYDVIPTLSLEQQQIILGLKYYADKYGSLELKNFIESYLRTLEKNKNLNFLRSMNFKSLLKAWSLEEQVKGIRLSQMQEEK